MIIVSSPQALEARCNEGYSLGSQQYAQNNLNGSSTVNISCIHGSWLRIKPLLTENLELFSTSTIQNSEKL